MCVCVQTYINKIPVIREGSMYDTTIREGLTQPHEIQLMLHIVDILNQGGGAQIDGQGGV